MDNNKPAAAMSEGQAIGYVSKGAIEHALSQGHGVSTYIQAFANDEFPVAIYTGQPAPVGVDASEIPSWQQRVGQHYNDSADVTAHEIAMQAEIADLRAALATRQPVATDAPNDGMHASIFVKVWGDAGGGDAGRIALANYAYELGKKAASQPVAVVEVRAQAESCLLRLCGRDDAHAEGCDTYDKSRYPDKWATPAPATDSTVKPVAAVEVGEVVAWRDPSNTDPGQSVTFKREVQETWPHIYSQPLFTHPAPATDSAVNCPDCKGTGIYEDAHSSFPCENPIHETIADSADGFLPLPEPRTTEKLPNPVDGEIEYVDLFDVDQVRAAIIADRAARQVPAAPAHKYSVVYRNGDQMTPVEVIGAYADATSTVLTIATPAAPVGSIGDDAEFRRKLASLLEAYDEAEREDKPIMYRRERAHFVAYIDAILKGQAK